MLDTALDPVPEHERWLVDPRLGLITQVVPYQPSPRMPAAWVGWSARTGDSRAFADWQGERYGFGAALLDHDRARRAAVGEAVERYCGNAIPARLHIATYHQLIADGVRALDPASFALYSPEQYTSTGFPFRPFTRDLAVAWVTGRDLHTDTEVLAPASMAYLNYYRGAHATETPIHAMAYAGIATGQNREHAERFALEELFERDANTIWWASGAPAHPIADAEALLDSYNIPGATSTASTTASDKNSESAGGRVIRVLRIPSQFPVTVAAVLIEEHDDQLIAYGTAARADGVEAVKKALVEAFSMLELTAEVADPASEHWRTVARGDLPPHSYRPFRADRRYADDFRADFHDLVDLPAVSQLYLDPRMQAEPLDRLRAGANSIRLADLPAVDDATARAVYLQMLAAAGLQAVSVDVTTDDVRAAGLCVVRVIVPGLYGNPPAAFPYLGGTRLYTVAHQLGLADRALTPTDLYPYPIPHV